ncbi:MAG: hypothetical protein K2X87_27920, partial [Gemmataceae bacterium]|nr:hypothetical protein [Gemmataceae bacterium]
APATLDPPDPAEGLVAAVVDDYRARAARGESPDPADAEEPVGRLSEPPGVVRVRAVATHHRQRLLEAERLLPQRVGRVGEAGREGPGVEPRADVLELPGGQLALPAPGLAGQGRGVVGRADERPVGGQPERAEGPARGQVVQPGRVPRDGPPEIPGGLSPSP